MKTLPKFFGVLIFVITTLGFLSAGWTSPSIKKVLVNTEKELITLEAQLEDAFSEKILEAIHSGVAITFTFEVELRKQASVFGDDVVSENKIMQTIQYDTLKKVYQFTSQGKNVNRTVSTKENGRYKDLMRTLKDIPIGHTYKLDPEEQYYARVKAKMESDGLWFPFNYLLFFVPFNEFETAWTQSAPLSLRLDAAFETGNSHKNSKSAIPAQGVANGIRSFNQ